MREKGRKIRPSARVGAGSRSGRTRGRNSHEVCGWNARGQVLIGIELHGEPVSLIPVRTTGLGRSPQNPPTTPNRHVFPQGDFGGHCESQFHDRAFRKSRLRVKENSAASQILSKSGHSPSVEVNRQRQVHFETLRAPAFQTMFNAIRICVHRPSLPDPVRGSTAHLNSIADRTGREVPNGRWACITIQTAKPCTTKATKYHEGFRSQAFPSWPWWLTVSQIDPRPCAVLPCRHPQDVKKF